MPSHHLPNPLFSEPVFQEGKFVHDPAGFLVPHPSDDALYAQLGKTLFQNAVAFDAPRAAPDDLFALASAYGDRGASVVKTIESAGQIVFHACGDTGASDIKKYDSEIKMGDVMATDVRTAAVKDRPSFFYQLGDVVYNFGESKYYYDQFYDPYRNYPAPIIAVPGNHDSFIVPGTAPAQQPLMTFMRNFCATAPAITPEAGSLHRTAMTQPGVYFTLDAPFVRIIGLFSNALEDPGVISSEGGRWPNVPDLQLAYLAAQLERIKTEKYAGAVLLAVHHPPFTYLPAGQTPQPGVNHGGSPDMLRDIDTVCNAAGVYPHAVLSAHAHNYQRYTRTVKLGGSTFEVPFIVCGSGGHGLNSLVAAHETPPNFGDDVSFMDANPAIGTGGLIIEKFDDQNYGCLRISVTPQQLAIGFYQLGKSSLRNSRFDLVTIDLASHQLVAN